MSQDIQEQIEGLQAGLSENHLTTLRIEKRLDRIDMNGHGPKLKEFLDKTAPKLTLLADYADEIITAAKEMRDGAAFWRVVRRFTGWNRGVKIFTQLLVGAILGGIATAIVMHLVSSSVTIAK